MDAKWTPKPALRDYSGERVHYSLTLRNGRRLRLEYAKRVKLDIVSSTADAATEFSIVWIPRRENAPASENPRRRSPGKSLTPKIRLSDSRCSTCNWPKRISPAPILKCRGAPGCTLWKRSQKRNNPRTKNAGSGSQRTRRWPCSFPWPSWKPKRS